MVRAKFQLKSILPNLGGAKTLYFSTVYDQSIPEDQRFQKATPWGEISMNVDNPAALEKFSIGGYYYLDFSPVPPQ